MKSLVAILALVSITVHGQQSTQQLISSFDKVLTDQFKHNEPGAQVLISSKGKIIYEKGFGLANMELNVPMTTDHILKIGSVTKQFTAVAILQLMEKGSLNLQDTIQKYLANYPSHGQRITIENLLTHTSGIRDYAAVKDHAKTEPVDMTHEEMLAFFKDQPLRFAPGTRWEYSNSNYFLLGMILEKVTGKKVEQYFAENIFKPLGMNHSYFGNDQQVVKNRASGYTLGNSGFENAPPISSSHPYAAGAIQSTVKDLFKWNQALQSGKLLKPENLQRALSPYKLASGNMTSYGYGWRMGQVYDKPSLWHGGLINGFFSMALYLPAEDIYVAILTNCDQNSPVLTTSRLAALAMGKPYQYKETPALASSLPQYAGVFENDKGSLRIISADKDGLYSQLGRGPKAKIRSYQKDGFFLNETQTLEFSRNAKGDIVAIVATNLNGNETWNKSNKPIPSSDGIKLDEKTLERYPGEYEVNPNFRFAVVKEGAKLFLQSGDEEKLEMFADAEDKFFLKVNDAEFEFKKDSGGKVTSVIMTQGGKQANAKKIK